MYIPSNFYDLMRGDNVSHSEDYVSRVSEMSFDDILDASFPSYVSTTEWTKKGLVRDIASGRARPTAREALGLVMERDEFESMRKKELSRELP